MSGLRCASPDSCHDCGLSRMCGEAVAEELVVLTGRLSELAFALGSDAETVRRHMGSLQAVDLISQIQLSLADFLRSQAPLRERIAQIPVEGLSARLHASLAVAPGTLVPK